MKKFYFLFFLLFTFTTGFSQLEGTTWKVSPTAQSLAVGPTQGDFSWWSIDDAGVSDRACFFDDQFVFEADGTFRNVQDGETWLEGWQGVAADGCGASVAPHDGSNAATWSYDAAAGMLTLNGVGAHLGIPKVHNGGELTSPAGAPASITYPVVIEGNTMTVDIDFGGTGFWHFVFVQEGEGGSEEPTEPASPVAGAWKVAPVAQSLAVGPTPGDFSWWSIDDAGVADRACFFDDQFVFEEDGTFKNVQDGETWLEAWQGVAADGCGASVAPHDGSNAATWSYDEAASTITLTGVGAHLGIPKVHNGGELTSPADAPESITYPVVIDDNTMTIDIDFGGTGIWHFVLQREGTTAPPPPPPAEVANVTFAVDMNGYTEAFTTVFVSGSFNGWEGETNPLSDADGDGIWMAELSLPTGEHEYKFTLDAWTVQEEFAGGDCTITDPSGAFTNRLISVTGDTEVCFKWNTCDACGTGTGGGGNEGGGAGNDGPVSLAGTWQVAPMAQALAVGPTKGDFSWWSSSAGDIDSRACFFDDQFVFEADGTFRNVQDGETWLEGWQGVAADACGVPVAPHDGSNAATWTVDEAAGTLTLTGVGAHLGLPKVHNGGELTSPADAPASITYPYVIEGNTMTVDIDFGGTGFWHFVFEQVATTSTREQIAKENLFSFSPNPAGAQIQIQSTELLDELVIKDITGRSLMSKVDLSSNATIDISSLNSGMYILVGRIGNKISVEKLSIR